MSVHTYIHIYVKKETNIKRILKNVKMQRCGINPEQYENKC